MKEDSALAHDGIPSGAYRCAGGLGSTIPFMHVIIRWRDVPFQNISLEIGPSGSTTSDIDDNGSFANTIVAKIITDLTRYRPIVLELI